MSGKITKLDYVIIALYAISITLLALTYLPIPMMIQLYMLFTMTILLVISGSYFMYKVLKRL
jgi:hypothetical protein